MEFAIVIAGLGIWLVIDGLYSIFKYRKQTVQEHLIKVIRAGVGVTLIAFARAHTIEVIQVILYYPIRFSVISIN